MTDPKTFDAMAEVQASLEQQKINHGDIGIVNHVFSGMMRFYMYGIETTRGRFQDVDAFAVKEIMALAKSACEPRPTREFVTEAATAAVNRLAFYPPSPAVNMTNEEAQDRAFMDGQQWSAGMVPVDGEQPVNEAPSPADIAIVEARAREEKLARLHKLKCELEHQIQAIEGPPKTPTVQTVVENDWRTDRVVSTPLMDAVRRGDFDSAAQEGRGLSELAQREANGIDREAVNKAKGEGSLLRAPSPAPTDKIPNGQANKPKSFA